LCDELTNIIFNKEKIKEMEIASSKLGILNADHIIYNEIKSLVKR